MEDADDALAGSVDAADDPSLEPAAFERDQPRCGARADREWLADPGVGYANHRRRVRAGPCDRASERRAVLVAAVPLDDRNLRALRRRAEPPLSGAGQHARMFCLTQHAAQRRPVGGRQTEGAGDLARPDRRWALANKIEQLGGRGKFASASPSAARTR